MVQLVKEFTSGVYNLVLGLFTTGKHLGRHAITVQYPKERWAMPERSRGMVVLLSDKETGELNCNACLLCMRGCPSGAIEIDYFKDEKNKRHLKGFKVDYNICCFCGLCEEACNFTAIKLATKYEFPEFDKDKLIWDTDRLQEMGRDVPYELKRKKRDKDRKPVERKPVEVKADSLAESQATEPESEKETTGEKPVSPQDGEAGSGGESKDEGK